MAELKEVGPLSWTADLDISQPLAEILGFSEVDESFMYLPNYYDMYHGALEWLRTPLLNALNADNVTAIANTIPTQEILNLQKWIC